MLQSKLFQDPCALASYTVTAESVQHLVDVMIGRCDCDSGQDGSECIHQVAVLNKHPSIECGYRVNELKARERLYWLACGKTSRYYYLRKCSDEHLPIVIRRHYHTCVMNKAHHSMNPLWVDIRTSYPS